MKMHQIDQDSLYRKRLNSFDLSTRTANCLLAARVDTIGELAALRSTDILRWQHAGQKTLAELNSLLGSVGLKFSDENAFSELLKRGFPPVDSEPTVLEEELYSVARAVGTERNAEILVRLWGWNGQAGRTLDSVGKEFALTRERVRQIEKRASQRLSKHRFELHFLRTAVSTLRTIVPDIESALGAALQERGVSRDPFSIESIQDAAERLRVEWPFEIVNLGNQRLLSLRGEGKTYSKAISLVQRITSERGCVNILSLASELQIDEQVVPALKLVLDAVSQIEWLDDSRTWLYSLTSARNRLFNLCAKILGVASRVHLSELRRAVSKSRRLAMCPPQKVLGTFIERLGLGRVEESIVLANPGSGKAPTEDSAEGIMLGVLDKFGPAMDGDVFAEKCVAAGMNPITFYLYRLNSPVICALGKNVYCKVGTNVAAGTVEAIVGQRRTVTRVSDFGWTSNGRLWFAFELALQIIAAGGIRLPNFVADLVQGDWQVVLPDESEYGTVKCRELYIWSFRKQFVVLGAEPGDMAAFEFDLKSRKVLVKVGGPDLLEALQDSDNAIPEDGAEEL
jgi:hypothetical protein